MSTVNRADVLSFVTILKHKGKNISTVRIPTPATILKHKGKNISTVDG